MSYQVKATDLLMEKNPSPAINTISETNTDYEAILNTNHFFSMPKLDKVSDEDRQGKNARSKTCNTYWRQPEISIQDDLELLFFPKMLRQAMGGTPVKSTVATGIFDYTFGILPPSTGNILPSRGFITRLGAAYFAWAGMTGDKTKLSQKGSERVKMDHSLVGTGKHLLTPGLASVPDPATSQCLDGQKVLLTYVDESSATIDLSNLGNVVQWDFSHDNLLRRNKRRNGDPELTSTSGGKTGTGAYVRRIPRGDGNLSYKTTGTLELDFADLAYWAKHMANTQLTNFKIKIPGPFIAAVSSVNYYYELEITIPLFIFEDLSESNDEGDATTPLIITPYEDPVTKQTFTARYRTSATSFEGVSS